MKLKLYREITGLLAILFCIIILAGCQEEFVEISDPDSETLITEKDTIAELILRVALKDGSFDNIIDQCSEISINFPYSVRIRNEIITLTTPDDIKKIEQEYFPLKGTIIINYPITVSFSNYSDSVLSNQGGLRRIQKLYNNNLEDDDIECIDFIYPVDLSIYNTEFQKPESVIAANDKEMYNTFSNLQDLIVEINYPVAVELPGTTTIKINDNKELRNEIVNASGTCDEDDETEINEEHEGDPE